MFRAIEEASVEDFWYRSENAYTGLTSASDLASQPETKDFMASASIRNSERLDYHHLSPQQLHNKRLCADRLEAGAFESRKRTRLKRPACPTVPKPQPTAPISGGLLMKAPKKEEVEDEKLQTPAPVLCLEESVASSICSPLSEQCTPSNTPLEECAGKETHTCSRCSSAFTSEELLQGHSCPPTRKKKFKCTICSALFSRKGTLKRHFRTHTGEKPFKCTTCNVTYSRQSGLNRHLRSHTGAKPFTCTVCAKSFSERVYLNAHLRVHTGERPFVCTVCEARFSQKCHLNQHSFTHTSEKPFVCNVCDATFSQKRNLHRHLSFHTGEEAYQCHLCPASYARKYRLTDHILQHGHKQPV